MIMTERKTFRSVMVKAIHPHPRSGERDSDVRLGYSEVCRHFRNPKES
jgi:hypothetical protein